MKKNNQDLRKRMSNLKIERLIEIINIDYAKHSEEAIVIVKEELTNRGMSNCILPHEKKLTKGNTPTYITLRELFLQGRFKEVESKIVEIYPIVQEHLDLLEKMFYSLLPMDTTTEKDLFISIQEVDNDFNPLIKDWEVFVLKGEGGGQQEGDLEDLQWADWMASLVKIAEVKQIGKDTFIAHCLYQMARPHIQEEEIEDDLPDLPPLTKKSLGDLLMGEIINIFGNMLPKSMVEKYYAKTK